MIQATKSYNIAEMDEKHLHNLFHQVSFEGSDFLAVGGVAEMF